MRAGELVFLLLLAGFLVGFCLLGQFHYGYAASLMLFPLSAAGITLPIVAIQLAILLKSRRGATAPAASAPERPGGMGLSSAPKVAALFCVVPLVFLVGYPVGLALYLLGILRQTGESWSVAWTLAAGSLLVSYGLFTQLLGVPLPLTPLWWPY